MNITANKKTLILLVEDDIGHAGLITTNLNRSSVKNEVVHFNNGEEVLSFLFSSGKTPCIENGATCVMLLDIRMPKVDGIEVLRQIKQDTLLRKIPVIIITTADNQDTINTCNELGCIKYVIKPVNYQKFKETIFSLGQYLKEASLIH